MSKEIQQFNDRCDLQQAAQLVGESPPSREECEKAYKGKHYWSKSRMRTLLAEKKGQQGYHLEAIKRASFQGEDDDTMVLTMVKEIEDSALLKEFEDILLEEIGDIVQKFRDRAERHPERALELMLAAQTPHLNNPDAIFLSAHRYGPAGQFYCNDYKTRDCMHTVIDHSFKKGVFTKQRSSYIFNLVLKRYPEIMDNVLNLVEERFSSREKCDKAYKEGKATKHFWSKSEMRSLLAGELEYHERIYLEAIRRVSFQSEEDDDTMVLYTFYSEGDGRRFSITPSFQNLSNLIIGGVAPKGMYTTDVDQAKAFVSLLLGRKTGQGDADNSCVSDEIEEQLAIILEELEKKTGKEIKSPIKKFLNIACIGGHWFNNIESVILPEEREIVPMLWTIPEFISLMRRLRKAFKAEYEVIPDSFKEEIQAKKEDQASQCQIMSYWLQRKERERNKLIADYCKELDCTIATDKFDGWIVQGPDIREEIHNKVFEDEYGSFRVRVKGVWRN